MSFGFFLMGAVFFSLYVWFTLWMMFDQNRRQTGILTAQPKQGKKNLAKFLGIDMSAADLKPAPVPSDNGELTQIK